MNPGTLATANSINKPARPVSTTNPTTIVISGNTKISTGNSELRDLSPSPGAGRLGLTGVARRTSITASVFHKLGHDQLRNHASFIPTCQEGAYRFPPARSKVKCRVIDVHTDESIGLAVVQVAAILQRIFQRLFAVIESIADALFQQPIDVANHLRTEVLADCVGAQRQRQPGGFL